MNGLRRWAGALMMALLVTTQATAADIITSSGKPTHGMWLCFRKAVTLSRAVSSATLRIAADSKYILVINGDTVVRYGGLKRGPNPRDTYIDTVTVRNLKAGHNDIAVLVWYLKSGGFSHRPSPVAGLYFDMEAGRVRVQSDSTWSVRRFTALYVPTGDTPNTRLAESNIGYNAAADTVGLTDTTTAGHGWEKAVVVSADSAKWGQFVLRPLPMVHYYGVRDYVSTHSSGRLIYCYLPYDAQVSPVLTLRAGAGKTVAVYSDVYPRMKPEIVARYEYKTRDGLQTFEFPGWISGHTIIYNVPAGVEVVRLAYRESGYACSLAGSFESDDEELNKLWRKAQRTLYVNMRDNFMDCPDRERAPYTGDEAVCFAQIPYALSPEAYMLMRKAVSEFFAWQRKDSVLYGPVPSETWTKEMPQQSLAFLAEGLWSYYMTTGDIATIKPLLPAFRKYLSLWTLQTSGLPSYRKGGWEWGDWGTGVDLTALHDAWYAAALRTYASLSAVAGNSDEEKWATERRNTIVAAYNRKYLTGSGYRSSSTPDDRTQGLAVTAGIAPDSVFRRLRNVMTTHKNASPYMEMYVLRALCETGYTDDALTRLRSRYKAMADSVYTTLWEHFSPLRTSSLNHAWSGAPLLILSRYVAGIEPIKPAFREFRVCPHMGDLGYVSTSLTVPAGRINLMVDTRGGYTMKVDVPKSCKARLLLPAGYVGYHLDGKGVKLSLAADTAYYELTVDAGSHRVEALESISDTTGISSRVDSLARVLRSLSSSATAGSDVGCVPADVLSDLRQQAEDCLKNVSASSDVFDKVFQLRDMQHVASLFFTSVNMPAAGQWYELRGADGEALAARPALAGLAPAAKLWRVETTGRAGELMFRNVADRSAISAQAVQLYPLSDGQVALRLDSTGQYAVLAADHSLAWQYCSGGIPSGKVCAFTLKDADRTAEVYSETLGAGDFTAICLTTAVDSIDFTRFRAYRIASAIKDATGEVTGVKLREITDRHPVVKAGVPFIVMADSLNAGPVRLAVYSAGGTSIASDAGVYNGLHGLSADMTVSGLDTCFLAGRYMVRAGAGRSLPAGRCYIALKSVRQLSTTAAISLMINDTYDGVARVHVNDGGPDAPQEGRVYTLDGVSVPSVKGVPKNGAVQKGEIFIRNGRKVIAK